ncbi:MAG: class I SAM-dependent methyltransferase [Planctomycetota bacterium]|jgi:2-polyprenyl-3-methyl-5-hydroxy-6-metoxy-1,4-benzoquinol methylase
MKSFQELRRKYAALTRDVESEIRPLLEAIPLQEIARHNAAYEAYGADRFYWFVEAEKNRYLNALDLISVEGAGGTVCDLGCFIPYLPLLLAKSGYAVKMVDRYELYGERFKGAIEDLAGANGIEVHDIDLLTGGLEALETNDVVLLMAVVEHLAGSPRGLLEKVRGVLKPSGLLLFEAPNIAEFHRRLAVLRGLSPLPGYEAYFRSDYPFMGHHREMTLSEVAYLLENTGYAVERLTCYDFLFTPPKSWKGSLAAGLKRLLPLKDKGQAILALARPRPA